MNWGWEWDQGMSDWDIGQIENMIPGWAVMQNPRGKNDMNKYRRVGLLGRCRRDGLHLMKKEIRFKS